MSDHDDDQRDIFGELISIDGAASSPVSHTEDWLSGLSNVGQSITSAGVGMGLPFLGLSRSGQFHYGAENVKVDPNSRLAVDLRSIRHGYSAWADGKLLDERMYFANEKLPAVHELPDAGAPWALAISFEAVFLEGTADAGTKVLYKNSSLGGRKAALTLIEQIKRQLKLDPSKPVPIIKLDVTSYEHKKYGETFVPIFTLIGFTDGRSRPTAPAKVNLNVTPPAREAAVEEVDDAPAPAPRARATKAAAPVPETAGRRRRVPA